MKIGNFNISNLKLGTVQIKKVFIGLDLVWTSFLSIINDFKARVLSSQGEFEGETCLNNTLEDMGIDLFDQASLVITPNGYKENVLFSVTPSPVGTNLLLQSEGFTLFPWTALLTPNITRTANAGISPIGTNNATLLTSNTDLDSRGIRQGVTLSQGVQYVFSIWARSDNGARIQLDISDNGVTFFNLTTEWQRIQVTGQYWVPYGPGTQFVDITFAANQLGKTCLVWGAQLEIGTNAGNYIPTVTRQAINETICDLSFTRATLAYRINQDKLVEPSPYNLFSWSEDFSNSLWSKYNLTITTNQTIAPDGNNTADLYVPNTTTGEHPFAQTLTSTGAAILVTPTNEYNWTIYVKSAGNNYFLLRAKLGGIWYQNIYNLSTGTVVASPNFISADIEDVGDGWYRLSCVFTNVDSPNTMQFVSTPNGSASFTGDGVSGAYIWGAQLTLGAVKRDYFPTTTRFNVPRINYPYNECPVILSEPQMTNSWTDNNNSTGYSSGGPSANIINNGTVYSAFGYGFNGFDYSFTGGATFLSSVYNIRTVNALNIPVHRVCLFIKNPSSDFFGINHSGGASQCFYQFSTLTARNYFDPATENGKIIKINDDTYALYLWSDTVSPGSQFSQIRVGFVTSLTDQITVDGTAIIGLGFWQGSTSVVNMQNHSYTPIVTTTAAVTRNVDFLLSNNAYSIIGQTEGTIFLDFDKTLVGGGIKTLLSMNTLINDETLYVQTSNNNVNLAVVIVSTSNSVLVSRSFTIPDGKNKLVIVYSTSGTKIFLNGTQLAPLTNTALPAMNIIYLGGRQGGRNYGNVREFVLWKTQITDTQAIELTTL